VSNQERITRRGLQLFQLALLMEIGDRDARRGQGAEALLYMADAIARLGAHSQHPRVALETVVNLFSKLQDTWFEQQRENNAQLPAAHHLISDIAFETVIGQSDPETALGGFAVDALDRLTDALIDIASLNSKPRQIIEHVMRRLDEADTTKEELLS
jgi:hypothetical protein